MAYIKATSIAVVMVVVMDSLMTFFGSTANDAAFNAWTADIATSKVPAVHLRSLERYDFNSVLLPYNICQMQNPQHAKDFQDLLAV